MQPFPGVVLIVEDDWRMCRFLQRSLESNLPDTVLTALDGPQAWGAYLSARPDVVVTGILMPGFDGFELIRRIRERDHATRILVLTAAQDEATRQKALAL